MTEKCLMDLLSDALKQLSIAVEELLKVIAEPGPRVIIRPREFMLVQRNDAKITWPKMPISLDISSLQNALSKIAEIKKDLLIKTYSIAETFVISYSSVSIPTSTMTPMWSGTLSTGSPIPTISYDCMRTILQACNYTPRNVLRALRRIEAATYWCKDRIAGIKKNRQDLLIQQKKWTDQISAGELGIILRNQ